MSIEVAGSNGIAAGFRAEEASPAVERGPVIRLNDPELTRRLDALFDDHFCSPRRPRARVMVNHWLKRGLDITVAGLGLLLCCPVIALAALATLCDTGRPVFYSQVRRIRFGHRARIYKMRTMRQGADRNLDSLVNIKNNGRFLNVAKAPASYTRVGRVLELLWIVELPQLWSVLKGQMSLVGNRPIPDYVIAVLGPTHEVAERFAGPQGLTGYTQIIGRENVTDEERIQLEYHYSRVFEAGDVFLEDLRIIGVTIMTYLGLGRHRCAEDFLGRPVARGHGNAASASADSTAETGVASAHCLEERLNRLACPTCYEAGVECDSTRCAHECVRSCAVDAVTIADGRAVFNHERCTACSDCITACPRDAVDKVPLEKRADGLHCPSCRTVYHQVGGVYDLLPRKANLEQSPYFDFYESQYVGDNPDVHLEDTAWKLRELRPLIKRDQHYRSMLDLGCGAGVLGRSMAAELNVADAVSADWSTQILGVARKAAPDGLYVRVDAAYLPFRNRSFDLALMIDVIEHQHRPDQVLAELQRAAGHLLIRTPLEDCWYESVRRRRKDLFRESSGHVVHYKPASVRAQLFDNGWDVRAQSVRHIAWSHWQRVLFGPHPLHAKATAGVRYALRWLLPVSLYRRLFVTNYNAFCAARRSVAATAASDGHGPAPRPLFTRPVAARAPGRSHDSSPAMAAAASRESHES